MQPLDRRTFFSHSLAAASGLVAAPTWLARAFGLDDGASQDPQSGGAADPVARWRKEQLAAAIVTAKAHGKPLLVLVVPEDREDARAASWWFGGWLTNGREAHLTFGLCKLACARRSEVQDVLGVRGDAMTPTKHPVTMLLIDVGESAKAVGADRTVTRVEVDLSAIQTAKSGLLGMSSTGMRRGFSAITESLARGLERHGATLPALAVASLLTLDKQQQELLARWVRTGEGASAELLVRGLGEVQLGLGELPEVTQIMRRGQLLDALRAEAPWPVVAGAQWRSRFCGGVSEEVQTPDGPERVMISCGMARVPPLCEDFLDFYTRPAEPK